MVRQQGIRDSPFTHGKSQCLFLYIPSGYNKDSSFKIDIPARD